MGEGFFSTSKNWRTEKSQLPPSRTPLGGIVMVPPLGIQFTHWYYAANTKTVFLSHYNVFDITCCTKDMYVGHTNVLSFC